MKLENDKVVLNQQVKKLLSLASHASNWISALS